MTETPIPAIDGFVEALGTSITYLESEWATYDPITDQVQVPPRGSRPTELHYVLVLHEHGRDRGHGRADHANRGAASGPYGIGFCSAGCL